MFEQLRNIRQHLGEISYDRRMLLHEAFFAASEKGATITDLLDILEEDCGQYQGSWISEYFHPTPGTKKKARD